MILVAIVLCFTLPFILQQPEASLAGLLLVWLAISVFALLFPLYFCGTRPTQDLQAALSEHKRRMIHFVVDILYIGIAACSCVFLISNKPGILYYTVLANTITTMVYAVTARFYKDPIVSPDRPTVVFHEMVSSERPDPSPQALLDMIPSFICKRQMADLETGLKVKDSKSAQDHQIERTLELQESDTEDHIPSLSIDTVRSVPDASTATPELSSLNPDALKYMALDKETRCSICLDDYQDGSRIMQLKCNHLYHGECIEEWLKTSAQCPDCRDTDLVQ